MVGQKNRSSSAKPCDSCKTASAAVFCRSDSAFICVGCDMKVHAPNKLSSRHARVWVCDVCEQAPAIVTCKADAAALCASCDFDIHSANPLSRRHERVPLEPFYDPAAALAGKESASEEEEAASWLIPNLNDQQGLVDLEVDSGSAEFKSAEYLFRDIDPYLDLDLFSGEQKQRLQYSPDGVVPDQIKNEYGLGPVVDGFPAYEMDFPVNKPFMYNFTAQSVSHNSVSSSSMEVGVVPDQNHMMGELSKGLDLNDTTAAPLRLSGMDREARVLRYREKRKNRKFEKTIRYASRKAYAEIRPRIKGRFAKRAELEIESLTGSSFGVVPSFTCHY